MPYDDGATSLGGKIVELILATGVVGGVILIAYIIATGMSGM